jgi:hypothetical protein
MAQAADLKAQGWLPRWFGPRLWVVLALAVMVGYPLDILVNSALPGVTYRTVGLSLAGLSAFNLFEHWPRRLPKSLARWVLQVVAVGLAMPITNFLFWTLDNPAGAPPFWHDNDRLGSFGVLTALALLFAPWMALAVQVRQKDALARHQALSFDLERSELERQALDARLHLLHAQVAPHFLFNTLANVKALVTIGSPRAPIVLDSLISYLRATVPTLNESESTLGQEIHLVQAYLELMHMRMPDRLDFALTIDETARELRCPPLTLLTLVENAVKHGIDPSEEGGRIDIQVRRQAGRCLIRVADTGVGLRQTTGGLGTGLSTLRQRLLLAFNGDAHLRLTEPESHGLWAEIDFPAEAGLAP